MQKLITVEGGEFTGKSSVVVPSLKKVLERAGYNTLISREPGGTEAGETIRQEIFEKLRQGETPYNLAKLFNKARKIHLNEVIIPFFDNGGNVVILDRYLDSTMVYQGLEGGVPVENLIDLEKEFVKNYYPDLTLITYFPENVFKKIFNLRRSRSIDATNRDSTEWDKMPLDMHWERQKKYFELNSLYKSFDIPRRYAYIDASKSPLEVIRSSCVYVSQSFPYDLREGILNSYLDLEDEGEFDALQRMWREHEYVYIENNLSYK